MPLSCDGWLPAIVGCYSYMPMSLPVDIIERIEREECILFVGPNASLAPAGHLGPPGPAILAAEIINRLGYVPEDVTLPWAAQLYELEAGRRELEDFVARRLGDPRY